jgi:hypothetical protein
LGGILSTFLPLVISEARLMNIDKASVNFCSLPRSPSPAVLALDELGDGATSPRCGTTTEDTAATGINITFGVSESFTGVTNPEARGLALRGDRSPGMSSWELPERGEFPLKLAALLLWGFRRAPWIMAT